MNEIAQKVALIRASPLFDESWYLARYPDVSQLGLSGAEHYVRLGGLLLRDPSPQFCARLYVEANSDAAESGEGPLLHYLRAGKRQGSKCFPVPDPVEPLARAGGAASIDRDMRTIQGSCLFDAEYYLQTYPDVRKHGMEPLLHYVKYGAREGRQPNPYFSSRLYRQRYQPDNDDTNPLAHYLTSSKSDGARTSELFDGQFYVSRYPDVPASGLKPLAHYLNTGLFEGRQVDFPHTARGVLPYIVDCRKIRVTIIVAVHNAYDAVVHCLHSVLQHTPLGDSNRLLIIDDASTDGRLQDVLNRHATLRGVSVVRNAENLGYTQTVNKGCELAGRDDVVLLNSDTLVTGHWLRNLKVAACRRERTGTVTPLSNNAGAFSVPCSGENELPAGLGVDAVARLLLDGASHPPFEVPTGNGFCMYIKRALIDDVGPFDALNFPVGYGEENDFCMRAARHGWSNVVDPSTYVGHVRSASFGERRLQLLEAGQARLRELHPTYAGAVRNIRALRGFQLVRYRLSRRLQQIDAGAPVPKPRIMYVISTRVGGTPQTNADLMHAVAATYDCYALWCDRHAVEVLKATGSDYETLARYPLSEAIGFATHTSAEYDEVVRAILLDWGVDLLHVRHLAWHSFNLVDVAKSLDIPVIHSFHDFYTICPSVNLVGTDGVYVSTGLTGSSRNPLWRGDPGVGAMTLAGLQDWQRKTQNALVGCDAFVTTSQSTKDILTDALGDLNARENDFHIIPHGRDFDDFTARADVANIADGEPLRVLVPGNIGLHKGMQLIEQVRRLDVDRCVEFHLLGKCDASIADSVTDHGSYTRSDFDAKVALIRPHLAIVWSIWPETWCHTLTECWASGVPVFGIALGAVRERIEQHGGGWLAASPASAEALYASLLDIRRSTEDRRHRVSQVMRWQREFGNADSIESMSDRYLTLYRRVVATHRVCA